MRSQHSSPLRTWKCPAACVTSGVPQEVLRRTVSTTLGADAVPVRVRVELIDASDLVPRTPYYYQLEDGSSPSPEELQAYHAVAIPGGTHGLNRRFYELLPEIYKKHDVKTLASEYQFPGVPETNPAGGTLEARYEFRCSVAAGRPTGSM